MTSASSPGQPARDDRSIPVIVPIATDHTHRAISRVAARADAVTQADRLGRYLVGAPTAHGDLNGTQTTSSGIRAKTRARRADD